jgi:hypothetical protein
MQRCLHTSRKCHMRWSSNDGGSDVIHCVWRSCRTQAAPECAFMPQEIGIPGFKFPAEALQRSSPTPKTQRDIIFFVPKPSPYPHLLRRLEQECPFPRDEDRRRSTPAPPCLPRTRLCRCLSESIPPRRPAGYQPQACLG